jgi:hypothetical protein
MSPKPLHAVAGVAAALFAFSLTACGGGAEADSESTAPAASAPAASTPAGSAPAESAPADEASSGSDGGSDGSDGKPSKQEIVEGLTTYYEESQGLPADKAEGFATCMVGKMYDDASTEMLIMMRDGAPDPTKMTADDAQLLAESAVDCTPEIQ